MTVAKRPSGTLATMIPIKKITASNQKYPKINAMIKNETPKKTATPVIIWIKWAISLAIGVVPTSNPEAKLAIRPITVVSPVLITIPLHVPEKYQEIVNSHNFYKFPHLPSKGICEMLSKCISKKFVRSCQNVFMSICGIIFKWTGFHLN